MSGWVSNTLLPELVAQWVWCDPSVDFFHTKRASGLWYSDCCFDDLICPGLLCQIYLGGSLVQYVSSWCGAPLNRFTYAAFQACRVIETKWWRYRRFASAWHFSPSVPLIYHSFIKQARSFPELRCRVQSQQQDAAHSLYQCLLLP
jgi:hypothetical protein